MPHYEKRIRRLRLLVFLAYTIAFTAPNYAHYQLSPLANRLMEELSLTQGQFAAIFSAPMIPSIFLSILCGILVDRYKYKYLVGAAIGLSALGVIGRIFASTYLQLYICMMLTGVSTGFVTAVGAKIMGSVFAPRKVALMIGYAVAIGNAGMILAMSTTAMFPSATAAFIVSGVLIAADLAVWFIAVPADSYDPESENDEDGEISIRHCLGVVLRNRHVWMVAAGMFFVNGALAGLSSLVSAALMSRGMSETGAGAVSAFIMVGNLCGSLFTPNIAARTGKTRPILVLLSLAAAAGTAFSWLASRGFALYAALLVTGFAAGGVLILLLSMNIRLPGVGPMYAGTAGGVTSTANVLGGVTIPAYIASAIAGGNYRIYFIVCGAGMLLCAAAMLLLPRAVDGKA